MMRRISVIGFYSACIIALLNGCAQIVAPTGGPKDTIPPKALSYSPENKSTHFSSNKIVIKFNKFIQLKNITNELVISPPLKRFPKVIIKKGKELELDLKDTLQDNTTYTFNFGNSIADINEGNIAPNFKYVVSTGSYLDSLKLSGQVKDAFTQNFQKDALVMLYADQSDSAAYKKLPSYCGRTDANGYYLIENIKSGSYKLIILSQSNNGYFYHPYTEAIAFNNKPILLNRNDTADASLFTEEEPKTFLVKARAIEKGKIVMVFNKPVDSISVKPLNMPAGINPATLLEYSVTHDTVNYWLTATNLDSLRFIVMRNGKNEDTATIYSFPGKTVSKKEAKPIPLKLVINAHDNFDFHLPIVIKAEHPLAKFNPSRIFLTHRKDSVLFKVDTSALPYRISLKCKLTSDSSYRLFIKPAAFTDIFGLVNDTLISPFKIQSTNYFGSLKMNLTFADKGSYIVQLLDAQGTTVQQDIVNNPKKSISYNALAPNTYRLRIIKDDNGDSKWTSGNYQKHLQPEKVYYYSQTLVIRSNWDLNQDWLVK
jgi:hypothetical protein